jgi:hypothetical protein
MDQVSVARRNYDITVPPVFISIILSPGEGFVNGVLGV